MRQRAQVRAGISRLGVLHVVLLGLLLSQGMASGQASEAQRSTILALLASPDPLPPRSEIFRTALVDYYGTSGRLVWQTGAQVDSFLAAVQSAELDGLDANDYRPETIAAARRAATGAESGAAAAAAEILLSATFLRYAADLRLGRVASPAGDASFVPGDRHLDPEKLLSHVADGRDPATVLRAQTPQHPEYRTLRAILAQYRAIAAAGGWPQVPPGDTLRPGMVDPRIAVVRARLMASGDLTIPASGQIEAYDPALVLAVETFQRRHGLEVDGLIGRQTLGALNVSVEERIRQIEINMERWRLLEPDFGPRYVVVNIAGFELRLVDYGGIRLSMKVVVGLPYRMTPVFSDRIRYLEINPDWTVPRRIAIVDKLPELQDNPQRLADIGFEALRDGEVLPVTAIDWSAYSRHYFPYTLRQRPGPENALGRIKFMFPNRFDVYLHDTPATGLFARAVRAFSSGCIRVERPVALAAELLRGLPGWSVQDIRQAIESGQRRAVNLPAPVPVHLIYATVWRGDDGLVQFRSDIYGRDAGLTRALSERPR